MKKTERLNNWATLFNLLISFPIIGKVFQNISEKGGEALTKKMEEVVGLSQEDAEKTGKDEIALTKVLEKSEKLENDQEKKKEFRSWFGELSEKQPKLATAFTTRIYNILVECRRPIKVSKGSKKNQENKSFYDDSEGILIAENLIIEILEAGDESKKLEVLRNWGIQVIEKKKPHPAVEKASEAVKKFAKETIKEGEKKNRRDLLGFLDDLCDRSKAWANCESTRTENQSE